MCPPQVAAFVAASLGALDVAGRAVLEVGSGDPDQVVRGIVAAHGPRRYVGVDLVPGPGVDAVCRAEEVHRRFGPGSFDVVIATEVLEHVRDWAGALHAWKAVLAGDGAVLVTTRSPGFEFHPYPLDFWRFDPADLARAFADCSLEVLARDPVEAGVFLLARRRPGASEVDLVGHRAYSVVRRRRAASVTPVDLAVARCLAWGKGATAATLAPGTRDRLRGAIRWAAPAGRR